MLRRLRGLASEKHQSAQAPLWCFSPAHFAVAGLCCAKPLSATAKRHIQPERYAKDRQRFMNIKYEY